MSECSNGSSTLLASSRFLSSPGLKGDARLAVLARTTGGGHFPCDQSPFARRRGAKRTDTPDPLSGPRHRGSNPCLPAISFCKAKRRRELAVKRKHHTTCAFRLVSSVCVCCPPLAAFFGPCVTRLRHLTFGPYRSRILARIFSGRVVRDLVGVHVTAEARREKPLATRQDLSGEHRHGFHSPTIPSVR